MTFGSGSDSPLILAPGSEPGSDPNHGAAQTGLLSQAQLNQLLAQINSALGQKGKYTSIVSNYCLNSYKNENWIIDSCATDHMTGNLDTLETKIKAKNLSPVTVANGSKVPIDQIGTTTILSNKISNVLYLPTFASNLISVSKITNELNCNVIFSPENVIFQGQNNEEDDW